jgi:hypothetical protein
MLFAIRSSTTALPVLLGAAVPLGVLDVTVEEHGTLSPAQRPFSPRSVGAAADTAPRNHRGITIPDKGALAIAGSRGQITLQGKTQEEVQIQFMVAGLEALEVDAS